MDKELREAAQKTLQAIESAKPIFDQLDTQAINLVQFAEYITQWILHKETGQLERTCFVLVGAFVKNPLLSEKICYDTVQLIADTIRQFERGESQCNCEKCRAERR